MSKKIGNRQLDLMYKQAELISKQLDLLNKQLIVKEQKPSTLKENLLMVVTVVLKFISNRF